MAETQTPSSEASTSTPAQTTPTKSEKVKIEMASTGGGFSLDSFERATGTEIEDAPEEDTDAQDMEDEGRGELIDKEDPEGDEDVDDADLEDEDDEELGDEEDESDEESEDDEEELDLDGVSKATKKGTIQAFTKDGKPVNLPADLEIEQVIDGETKKVKLWQLKNIIAGELTVESRLGKVSSFREEVEQRRIEIEQEYKGWKGDIETILDYAAKGQPDLAICYLAERRGMSPIQLKRSFLNSLVAEAKKFEGKSETEIDNYYLNLESKWRKQKEQKEAERTEKQKKARQFADHVTSELRREGLTPQEFTVTTNELRGGGKLDGLTQEAALDVVLETALLRKHEGMASKALQTVDPKLKGNKKLLALLLEHTHPNKFTVEEMAKVVRVYLGKTKARLASDLSKKVSHQKTVTKPEKQNEAGKNKKPYRSQGDLQKAFGL